MKKSLLSVMFLLVSIFVIGQSVPRQMVALEIGTGTWCTYCPGAAMGADDLLEAGCLVAVVENHNGDSYANGYSNARNTYYGISSFPTAVFDGKLKVVGGSHSSSMYGSYLPKYNTRINTPANIIMSMDVTHTNLDYTAVITMEKVGTLTPTDLKLHFCITQSGISQNWQGQTHLEHVNRKMVPDQNGTAISFTSGDIQTVTLNFTLESAWPVEDVEFVTFVQSQAGKEVAQCIKQGAINLSVDFTASATQVARNTSVTFTNGTFGGYIGVPETYEWHFPGATPDTSSAKDPTVTYTECGPHDVMLIVDRGGQIDTVTKSMYIQVGPIVNITAEPDDTTCWYQPITLDATTPDATYLWQPGGATTPTIDVTFEEYGMGTHLFQVTVNTPDGCEQIKIISAYFDACTGIGEKNNGAYLSVYPNPSTGRFTIEMNAEKPLVADLTISNTLGAAIYTENGISINGKTQKELNLKNLHTGIYFLSLTSGEMKIVQKLFIR